MYSAKDRGEKRNRHKPHRSKISTRRKSCCVFGGTAKGLCIMSCFRKTRRLILRNIVPNWTVWRQQSTKSIQNCQIVMVLCFIKTTLDLTSLWQHDKNYCSLFEMSCFIRFIHLILHYQIFIYLDLCKILLLKKISSLEDCKKHLEKFFAYKTRKFWEDGIFKLPERWRKSCWKKRWIHYWIKLFFNEMKILF